MRIVILDLNDKDTAEELWALQHAAYRREAELIGVADLPPLRDTVESLQACGETFVGCLMAEGELAGAVSFEEESEGVFTICRVMVHPNYFRQGIASRLLRHVLAESSSLAEWTVTAEKRNTPALALYESFGFAREESFSPAPDITMIQMRKKLG